MITEIEALCLIRQKHYRLEITAEEREHGSVYVILSNQQGKHLRSAYAMVYADAFAEHQNCLSFVIRHLVEKMVKEEDAE